MITTKNGGKCTTDLGLKGERGGAKGTPFFLRITCVFAHCLRKGRGLRGIKGANEVVTDCNGLKGLQGLKGEKPKRDFLFF